MSMQIFTHYFINCTWQVNPVTWNVPDTRIYVTGVTPVHFHVKLHTEQGELLLYFYISSTSASDETECHYTSALQGNWFLEYEIL